MLFLGYCTEVIDLLGVGVHKHCVRRTFEEAQEYGVSVFWRVNGLLEDPSVRIIVNFGSGDLPCPSISIGPELISSKPPTV